MVIGLLHVQGGEVEVIGERGSGDRRRRTGGHLKAERECSYRGICLLSGYRRAQGTTRKQCKISESVYAEMIYGARGSGIDLGVMLQ